MDALDNRCTQQKVALLVNRSSRRHVESQVLEDKCEYCRDSEAGVSSKAPSRSSTLMALHFYTSIESSYSRQRQISCFCDLEY